MFSHKSKLMIVLKDNPLTFLALGATFVALLLLDNPIWEVWEAGFSASFISRIENANSSSTLDSFALGYFLFRGYYHVQVSCSKINEFSTTQDLFCEGLLTKKGTNKTYCGGIKLENGLCVMAQKSKFLYKEEHRNFLDRKLPWCEDQVDFSKGNFGRLQYYAPNCDLVDLKPAQRNNFNNNNNGKLLV